MPKIIDHDQRRREIVAVAKKLIIQGGFEAATMRSIVAEAGFANGALKRYFPSKDSIVAATFQSVLADMHERMMQEGDPSADPREALRRDIEATLPLDRYRIDSARVLLALWEHSMANEELAVLYRDHLHQWRRLLGTRIAAARGRDEAADEPAVSGLAGEIIGMSIGANVTSLMFPDGTLIPEYLAHVDRLMRRLDD
ncbi:MULTISPECIES: TetR/AcrR family transcriptional regulator [unclassified Streptomyces]|uniref:TetR/AcrR family transcriptional regulator n=1 Tax=unclassified Streptomyces TaxID=2593676 RepID=UPI00136DC424|nr:MULTISPECIES: TetR/AcrR family transcriptional regulator [unclassified Streptomyces]MCW5252555.1 TetR family transcriptional regulator [Streptomyces sp. SHP 1-2]MYU26428.1 TetR family transcriptional regulator [Streptomyces sp. SID8352]